MDGSAGDRHSDGPLSFFELLILFDTSLKDCIQISSFSSDCKSKLTEELCNFGLLCLRNLLSGFLSVAESYKASVSSWPYSENSTAFSMWKLEFYLNEPH